MLNKRGLLFLIVLVTLILGLIFVGQRNRSDVLPSTTSEQAKIMADGRSYETKTDIQTSVSIEVTPTRLGVDESTNSFEVQLNTHSVDLNYDFKKVIALKDNLGNRYSATEWTGGEGGHHLSGEIFFPKLNSQTKSVSVEIMGVGEVERKFSWEL